MSNAIERLTGLRWQGQGAAFLVASGHGATHWIMATFYVLVPYIREDLGLSYTEAGGFASVFFAASFAANAGSGPLVDITGRRVTLQALSLVVGGLAFMTMGLAEGVWLIVAMLVIIGCTNNLWHPAAISYLSNRFPGNRGYVLSIHTLGASFGDTLGPLTAGVLLVVLSWQATASVIALPVFAVALWLFLALGEGTSRRTEKAPPQGMKGSDYLGGILRLIRDGAIIGVCLMAAFRSMAQNGLFLFLPLLMKDVMGFGPVLLGVALTAMQIGGMFSGPVAGVLSDRIGRRPVLLAGMASTTAVVALVPLVDRATPFIGLLVVLGIALFAVRPVIHSLSLDLAPREMGGSVISLLFGTQSGFSTITPLLGGLIADTWGLAAVFYVLAGFMVVSTLIVLLLPKPARQR